MFLKLQQCGNEMFHQVLQACLHADSCFLHSFNKLKHEHVEKWNGITLVNTEMLQISSVSVKVHNQLEKLVAFKIPFSVADKTRFSQDTVHQPDATSRREPAEDVLSPRDDHQTSLCLALMYSNERWKELDAPPVSCKTKTIPASPPPICPE